MACYDEEELSAMVEDLMGNLVKVGIEIAGETTEDKRASVRELICDEDRSLAGLSAEFREKVFTTACRVATVEGTCAICLGEIASGDAVCSFECDHEFCVECMRPWVAGGQNSCPTCRQHLNSSPLMTYDEDKENEHSDYGEEEFFVAEEERTTWRILVASDETVILYPVYTLMSF